MFQGMIKTVFQNTMGVDLGEFPVMTYQDAMHLYGSDKPDLRVNLQFAELTDVMKDVDFKVFSGAATMKGGRVVACACPAARFEGGGISRGEIDAYTEFVKIYGAKGLAYIRVNELAKAPARRWPGLQSPIVKNIHDTALPRPCWSAPAPRRRPDLLRRRQGKIVNDAIGALRLKIGHSEFGKKNGLFEPAGARCGWWTSRCSSTTRKTSATPPCTTRSPRRKTTATRTGWSPRPKVHPRATTWCLNGWEMGGGSVRIHRADVQSKVFDASRSAPRKRKPSSASCSTPCSTARPARRPGLRPGPHRHADDRRRVDPRRDRFPQDPARPVSADPAPSPVDEKQLRELHISFAQPGRCEDGLSSGLDAESKGAQ